MNSIREITFDLWGVSINPQIARHNERWKKEFPSIVVKFSDEFVPADQFISALIYKYPVHDWRHQYDVMGSTEWEYFQVMTLAEHVDDLHGRYVAQHMAELLRTHILTKWTKLAREYHGKLGRENGLRPTDITDVLQWKNVYGWMLSGDIKTPVVWDEIPEESEAAPHAKTVTSSDYNEPQEKYRIIWSSEG